MFLLFVGAPEWRTEESHWLTFSPHICLSSNFVPPLLVHSADREADLREEGLLQLHGVLELAKPLHRRGKADLKKLLFHAT